MTPVTKHEPILEDWSDDRLAVALRSCDYTINRDLRDDRNGRPTREAVQRRLAAARENLAASIAAAGDSFINELVRSESPRDAAWESLATFAALRVIAADPAAWQELSGIAAAPIGPNEGDRFGYSTDAEATAARTALRVGIADALDLRPLLIAETKRRRIVAERAAEASRLAAHRANVGRA